MHAAIEAIAISIVVIVSLVNRMQLSCRVLVNEAARSSDHPHRAPPSIRDEGRVGSRGER
jgi:hypothetical protein